MTVNPARSRIIFYNKKTMRSTKNYLSLLLLLVIIACNDSHNQQKEEVKQYVPTSQELYAEITNNDSLMFNAFNAHDLDKLMLFFDSSLEFYHDKGGLTNYEHTINFMKEVAKNNNGLRRDLVKGSLEVYPIPGYGAMEIGTHTFCHLENGKQDCGTFKFVHIWQKKNGEWKITRVVSYDH